VPKARGKIRFGVQSKFLEECNHTFSLRRLLRIAAAQNPQPRASTGHQITDAAVEVDGPNLFTVTDRQTSVDAPETSSNRPTHHPGNLDIEPDTIRPDVARSTN
jgi:hypothetical protein